MSNWLKYLQEQAEKDSSLEAKHHADLLNWLRAQIDLFVLDVDASTDS